MDYREAVRGLLQRARAAAPRRRTDLLHQITERARQLSGEQADGSPAWSSPEPLGEILRLLDIAATRQAGPDSTPTAVPAPKARPSHDQEPPPIVETLARSHDWLSAATGQAPAAARPWLERMERDLAKLMAQAEMKLLRRTGAVDLVRDEVVGTVPATARQAAGQIAEIVRPAVIWRDRLIQPQRVITFEEKTG